MAPDVEEAVATLLAVEDLDERAVLVHRLEDSLHPSSRGEETEIGEAWRSEIQARVQEILDGTVSLVDAEETDRLIGAELADLHR